MILFWLIMQSKTKIKTLSWQQLENSMIFFQDLALSNSAPEDTIPNTLSAQQLHVQFFFSGSGLG